MNTKQTSALSIKINLQNTTKEKKLLTATQAKKLVGATLIYNALLTNNLASTKRAHDKQAKPKQNKKPKCAVDKKPTTIELTIRLIGNKESADLNFQYRHKEGPTNILSFPATEPEEFAENYLGDLALCIPLVKKEAREQNKTFAAHLTHLVIHGTLHCLGYTHDKKLDTNKMENIEIEIMQQLGYDNPYAE